MTGEKLRALVESLAFPSDHGFPGGRVTVARGDSFNLSPHAPAPGGLSAQLPAWLVLVPFAPASVDLSLNGEPGRPRLWAAGSAVVLPPQTSVEVVFVHPVEFLAIVVEQERAERSFAEIARERCWKPAPIEDMADPGIAALAHEARRSLLGAPLVETIYLGRLADAALARVGCHLSSTTIGHGQRGAISPGVLRRIVQHIEALLREKLVVENLADAAGLSRSHFTRAFQTAT